VTDLLPVTELPVPEGLTARPLTADDVAPVAALMAAAEQVDDTGEYPDADDLAEWWTAWRLDPERDGVAICDGTGLVVAFATAMAPHTFRGSFSVYLEGRVRPDHRGRASAGSCWTGSWRVVPRSTPSGTRRRRAG
jgi:mycothiol synthase